MNDSEALPWLAPTWQQLSHRWEQLPHGLLITGPPAVGKSALALDLARLLLCHQPEQKGGCRQCAACQLFDSSIHPDFHVLAPETLSAPDSSSLYKHAQRYWTSKKSSAARKPSQVIGVDAIRTLAETLTSTATQNGRKLSVIANAEDLNHNAGNALLKLLEEPTPDTHLVLVSAQPYLLPATIRSRCIRLDCTAPTTQQTLDWLCTRHNIDLDFHNGMTNSGLGPLELERVITEGRMQALTGLVSPSGAGGNALASPQEFVSTCAELGLKRALTVVQNLALMELRWQAQKGALQSAPATRFRFANRDMAMKTFYDIGRILRHPAGTVDEQLFLEDIFADLQGQQIL